MKKILYSLVVAALMITTISCEDKFLNLDPLDSPTEAIYFKTPDHFKAATNDFYNKMVGFKRIDDATIFDFVDTGSDLAGSLSDYGRGAIGVPSTDIYWRNSYRYIRSNNYVIRKGEEYTGNKAEIQQYIAAAHFFRAWHHFFLVKRFGGVPVVTKVPDLSDPILTAPRNTRYEVIEQVLKDLDVAIEGLPLESNIVAADKGHLSKQAAKSFKARVLLYEGTWEKYVGETTDFAQGQKKADKVTAYLTEAASLAKDVMNDGTFRLFNELDSLSYYYLFVLEDNKSNPKGLTKANNNEFIFKNMYDKNLNRAALNISHSWGGAGPNRKMMDMYLCKDGLPYTHSPMAKGYNKMTDEFQNRDARLANFVRKPGQKYWGWGVGTNGGGADYTKANYTNLANWPANIATYYPNLAQVSTSFGYGNRKWVTENPGTETEYESYDYPQIRLAELYLIYAEAMCELGGGKISDADLNISVNKIRARAYVAPLTNALIAPYPGLTMLGEIRRERALEMYMENTRFDDLKRWGIAEAELNKPILGIVVKNPDGSPTEVATFKNGTTALYNPAVYPYGVDAATGALIIDQGSNRKFTKKNYLWPLPTDQRLLNPNLVQNPGY